MSLQIRNSKYVSVFQAEDKGKYVQSNLSTGKKKQDGTWDNMYWKARFVGKCKDEAVELQDKDKIEIKQGIIENNYDKENKKLWLTVVIFDFEVMNKAQKDDTLDDFEAIDDEDMTELPF